MRVLWRELLRVCECDVLHRHGIEHREVDEAEYAATGQRTKVVRHYGPGHGGCMPDCPACKVLKEAKAL